MPSGCPIRSDSETDANVSANVRTTGSHRPIVANNRNAVRTPSAARRPPKRSTTSVPSAVVPTHVSLKKNEVSQPTRSSRNVAVVAEPRLEVVEILRERVPRQRGRPRHLALPAEERDHDADRDRHDGTPAAAPPGEGRRRGECPG